MNRFEMARACENDEKHVLKLAYERLKMDRYENGSKPHLATYIE